MQDPDEATDFVVDAWQFGVWTGTPHACASTRDAGGLAVEARSATAERGAACVGVPRAARLGALS